MISFRLWRSISDAAIEDPIFRRASQSQRGARAPKGRSRLSRLLILLAGIAFAAALIHSPALLTLVLLAPMLLIMLMAAAPILLPLYLWAAGIQLTSEVIGGVFREKHQYTYDLICASTRGALAASWAFAIGVLYRCGWFLPLRWGTRLTLRFGLALLGGLIGLALLAAISSGFGFEQARLLLLAALLLALYYSNMTQTLALSLVAGLFVSSFDLSRSDSMLMGIFLYALLSALPVLAGALVLVAFGMLAVEPGPAARMLVEAGALLLALGLREAGVALLWRGLARRLEWGIHIRDCGHHNSWDKILGIATHSTIN